MSAPAADAREVPILSLDLSGISLEHRTMLQSMIEILRQNGPMTRCDLEVAGGWRPNQVSGRAREAIDRGFMLVVGETSCRFHEARGGVEILDLAPYLRRSAGRQRRLDNWSTHA